MPEGKLQVLVTFVTRFVWRSCVYPSKTVSDCLSAVLVDVERPYGARDEQVANIIWCYLLPDVLRQFMIVAMHFAARPVSTILV